MTNVRLFALFGFALTILLSLPNESSGVGRARKLSGMELIKACMELNYALTKLAFGSGPSYMVVKVNCARQQVVSGTLTKYNVDLENSNYDVKNCNVDIWLRPWLTNGKQITIACDGEPKVVENY